MLAATELRGSAAQRIAALEAIADDPLVDPGDRIRAIDLLFRYGLGPVSEHEVQHNHTFTGLLAVLEELPAENLKLLETMSDEELASTVDDLLGSNRGEARAELMEKLERHRAAPEPPDSRKALPEPARVAGSAPDPTPAAEPAAVKQEPAEVAEAVLEPQEEPPKPPTPTPGWSASALAGRGRSCSPSTVAGRATRSSAKIEGGRVCRPIRR